MKPKYRFQWYQQIYENFSNIREEALKYAQDSGLNKFKDSPFGTYPGSSSCPGALPNYVLNEIIRVNKSVIPIRSLEDELRNVIKDIYGDEYDSAATNTCEASLRVSFETLMAPPMMRKGDAYRARIIVPYGEDYEYLASYGRPFPPKYKNIGVDRSISAGELAVEAKCLANLDSVLVRFAGAKYEVHGIRQNIVPLLTRVDPLKTIERFARVANRHGQSLSGFGILGYDTCGYGYGEKDQKGISILKKDIGNLAVDYDVPYLLDGGGGMPVIGMGPQNVGGDIMMWSMDKAARSPICGLIVGKEEVMVPIRKGLGMGGARYGEVSSHGKGRYAFMDPGRDSVAGLVAVLKMLRDNPEKIKKPIDQYHDIIVEEFKSLEPNRFTDKLIIEKSYTMGGTELNYENTWDDEDFGIPIFTLEDLWANTNPMVLALDEMGVGLGATIYSGNMFLVPGLGTLDEEGELIKENAKLAIQALVKSVEITCKYSGLTD